SLDGVTVMLPGYRPTWVWDLWQKSSRANPVVIEPLPAADVEAQMNKLIRLLQRPKLVGPETDPFGYCGGEVEVRFTEEEAALVESFLHQMPKRSVVDHSGTLPNNALNLPVRPSRPLQVLGRSFPRKAASKGRTVRPAG